MPSRRRHHGNNQNRQENNNDMFELLVQRQPAERRAEGGDLAAKPGRSGWICSFRHGATSSTH